MILERVIQVESVCFVEEVNLLRLDHVWMPRVGIILEIATVVCILLLRMMVHRLSSNMVVVLLASVAG